MGVHVTLKVVTPENKIASVGFCRTTEVFTPDRVIEAAKVAVGDEIYVPNNRDEFIRVRVEKIETQDDTIPA